jgi:hypothetical protein
MAFLKGRLIRGGITMAVSDPKVRAVFWAGGSPGRSAPQLWTVPPELARMQVFRATATPNCTWDF